MAIGRNCCFLKSMEGVPKSGFESVVAESATNLLSTISTASKIYLELREAQFSLMLVGVEAFPQCASKKSIHVAFQASLNATPASAEAVTHLTETLGQQSTTAFHIVSSLTNAPMVHASHTGRLVHVHNRNSIQSGSRRSTRGSHKLRWKLWSSLLNVPEYVAETIGWTLFVLLRLFIREPSHRFF